MKSETISALAKALSKAQSEMPTIAFNAKNPFLKNRYADLSAITAIIKPILAKHGLSYVQPTIAMMGSVGIETILMHESGEWIGSEVYLPIEEEKGRSTAQSAGSIITYLRRYSLSSMLGLVTDEDADGGEPLESKQETKITEKTEVSAPERPFAVDTLKALFKAKTAKYLKSVPAITDYDKKLIPAQLNYICNGDDNRHVFTEKMFGVSSIKDLSNAQMRTLLDWIGVSDFDAVPEDYVVTEAVRIIDGG